jgi:hypothetical protein
VEALDTLPADAFPRTGKDVVVKGFRTEPDRRNDGGVALL